MVSMLLAFKVCCLINTFKTNQMGFIFLVKFNSPQIQEALILDVIKKQTAPSQSKTLLWAKKECTK